MLLLLLPPLLVLSEGLLILERGAKIPARNREEISAVGELQGSISVNDSTYSHSKPRGRAPVRVNHDSGEAECGASLKSRVLDLPCFIRQVKYCTPATEPSFFPSGRSSSTPAHRPPENSVLPQKRRVPT